MSVEVTVPYLDLRAQYHSIKPEIDAAVGRVLESTQYSLGDEVIGFERAFAEYCRTRETVAVNSGTSALHLALLAAGVGPDDEVITVPFTFVATVAAIEYTGARPVLVDVDPRSYTMDPALVEAAITSRTRAIVPVHLYGQPADMDPLLAIARRHGLRVVEDAAQAHGAEYHTRRVGGIGDLGCFSFYPGKNLGAYGEGGMIVTTDAEHARRLRMLRHWGQERGDQHALRGYNHRMDALQAAILRVKLRHLEKWTEARRAHAAHYAELLADITVERPQAMPYARHVYHVYAIQLPDRERVRGELGARGIQTRVHYPLPVHQQEAYADLGYPTGAFPVSERLARRVLSLPMYPELSDEQARVIADAVRALAAPA
jgi:dTDP-4-amino-4,6-dideoxygalactose transaminase